MLKAAWKWAVMVWQDNCWFTCFHKCPLQCYGLSALGFTSLSDVTHSATCGFSWNHAVYLGAWLGRLAERRAWFGWDGDETDDT